ncbi:tetratricopeptide repeat-containing S1 family peptidase [Phragmitibacter flavus]|nr:trypsin-like peptidase domain-containing protein [Phragmitibacter flavus]
MFTLLQQFFIRTLCLLACGLVFAMSGSAQAQEASGILDRVSPSVVVIESADVTGSGVVISEQGLILTSLPLVASRIDFKAYANIRRNGVLEKVELTGLELVKIHPKLDLALLQARVPQGASMVPARLLPARDIIQPGTRCYVVGTAPGPGTGVDSLTIGEGLVSAGVREIEGREYLQVSAPIHANSSGAPIFLSSGQVIGIAAWKMQDSEGIAFATPTQTMALQDFIPLANSTGDAVLADQASAMAERFMRDADSVNGDQRVESLIQAIRFYRVMLSAMLNNPTPLHNIGVAYHRLGDKRMAKKYFEAAVKIAPEHGLSLHLLGIYLMQEQPPKEAEAMELWFRAVTKDENKIGARACAEDLAIAFFNQGRIRAASYMLRWADSLHVSGVAAETPISNGLWSDLEKLLPADQFSKIKSFKGPFSKEQLAAIKETPSNLAAGKASSSVTPMTTSESTMSSAREMAEAAARAAQDLANAAAKPTMPKTSSDVDTLQKKMEEEARAAIAKSAREEQGHMVTQKEYQPVVNARDRQALAEALTKPFRALATRKPVPEGGVTIPLPEKPATVITASAGWQLVMHFPKLAKLGIFNLASQEFDGFVDVDEEKIQFASGGSHLVVYSPSNRQMAVYDLRSLSLIGSKVIVLDKGICHLEMGLFNENEVFVLYSGDLPQQQFAGRMGFVLPALVRLPDLAVLRPSMRLTGRATGKAMIWTENMQLSGQLDESGTSFVIQPIGHTGSFKSFTRVTGNQVEQDSSPFGESIGPHAQPVLEGRLIISKTAVLNMEQPEDLHHRLRGYRTAAGKPLDSYSRFFTPIIGFPGMLEVTPLEPKDPTGRRFQILGLPRLHLLKDIPLQANESGRLVAPDRDDFLFASAYSDLIAWVAPRNNQLTLFTLGLADKDGRLKQLGTPGTIFQHQLTLSEGVKTKLEFGPPGLTVTESGKIEWPVPSEQETGQVLHATFRLLHEDGSFEYLSQEVVFP